MLSTSFLPPQRAQEEIQDVDTVFQDYFNYYETKHAISSSFQVPENFRLTVQATLREFFQAISANKDAEPSWKKPIYKIIARMDDAIPEYFKSPNWMEQLGDA